MPKSIDNASKTDVAIAVVVVGALAWEGWTLVNRTPHDTISERVWKHAPRRPLIPFAIGLLCGHFFWQAASDETVSVEHADVVNA